MPQHEQISVLFCCMGNICRSTMAEGVFQALTKKHPYKDLVSAVDSCGTIGYHTGDEPDDRTMATLEENGITDYEHRARKISLSDFERFDYILAMDRQNLAELHRLKRSRPNSKAKVMLFGEFSGTGKVEIVSDPYYGARDGFSVAFEQTSRFSRNFLEELFPHVRAKKPAHS